MPTKPVRGQRTATNKKTTAKKKAMPKIPKDMSKMKLTRALTPAQRRQQASVDQQAEYAKSKKKKPASKKK
jgi:ribosomal protein S13